MEQKEYDVFISYSRKDYVDVSKIKEEIESATGFKCWMDLEGISYTSPDFVKIIAPAIENAHFFVFVLTEESQISRFARNELLLANKKNKSIFFLMPHECEMTSEFVLEYGHMNICQYDVNYQKNKFFAELIGYNNSKLSEPLISKDTDNDNIENRAYQGDAEAQYMLGYMYSQGYQGCMDYYKAVEWWKKAAEQGHAEAMYRLAKCCEEKLGGLTQGIEGAIWWYRKSAELGVPESEYKMGICYKQGIGVKQDPFEAVKWWQKAVSHGNSNAMYKLSQCYKYGKGIFPSETDADRLLYEAAKLGNKDAQKAIAKK